MGSSPASPGPYPGMGSNGARWAGRELPWSERGNRRAEDDSGPIFGMMGTSGGGSVGCVGGENSGSGLMIGRSSGSAGAYPPAGPAS